MSSQYSLATGRTSDCERFRRKIMIQLYLLPRMGHDLLSFPEIRSVPHPGGRPAPSKSRAGSDTWRIKVCRRRSNGFAWSDSTSVGYVVFIAGKMMAPN